ncbi:MAG: hypothetical protein NVSMB56_02780 [Pyrinomonadaceae bacterium]
MVRLREIDNLDCDADVLTGARNVLQTLLSEVYRFQDAALDWSETEGVHDMRVASRRLRSALRDFKPHLKHAVNINKLKKIDGRIKMLAENLGMVRDLDVQIASLEKLQTKPTDVADVNEHIEYLITERKVVRDIERRGLVGFFEKINFLELEQSFIAILQDDNKKNDKTLDYTAAAQKVISKSYQEFQHLTDALFNPRSANRLHRLRIAAKRLRYALELFAPCFQKGMKHLAKEIAELQTSLGTLHDCDVWLDEIGARLKKMEYQEGKHNLDREALVYLLLHFSDERSRAFRDSVKRWNKWEHQNFGDRLLAHVRLNSSTEIDNSVETERINKTFELTEEPVPTEVTMNETV